jgi:regulator of nonsense transcripts 1
MPPQIGKIISEAVYENRLKSNPLHPITDQTTACYFIDVPGKEASLSSGSFKVFILFYF